MKKKILFILSTLVLFTSFSFADEYPDYILPPYQKVTEVMDSKNFCDVYIFRRRRRFHSKFCLRLHTTFFKVN